ncbi:class I SAM-dependent methyltransferase [Bounagaea algeriensis]
MTASPQRSRPLAPSRRTATARPGGTGLGNKVSEYRTFLGSAVRKPRMMGAATPTSPAVAATVAQVVPTTGTPVVVELGPGTGSLSEGIHRRLPSGARHIGIELGAELAEHLRTHKPWMEVVHGDARELGTLLGGLGVHRADAVISSIPWSLLDDEQQQRVLEQVTHILGDTGAFTAVTYLPVAQSPNGRRFRDRLDRTFDEILTHTTWRNLPPILHYLCRRPLR